MIADVVGRCADVAQLALGCGVARPLFGWLRRERPEAFHRMRHEPFAARGQAFVREVGALEKAAFVAKMVASDGAYPRRRGPRRPPSAEQPPARSVEVLFVGDVLHPGVADPASLSPSLLARIAQADCVVANLEATIGDRAHEIAPLLTWRGVRQLLSYEEDPTNADWASRVDSAGVQHLFKGRRVVVSVANNHTLDEGDDGFARTVDRAKRAGMDVVGDARRSDGGIVLGLGARRLGLFAMTYGSNREAAGHHLRFDDVPYRIDPLRARSIVGGLVARGATEVVAILHWGHEHEHEPTDEQRATAQELFDAGVTAVVGHHPHIVQRSEVSHRGRELRWVSYSLGDFIGGDRTIWSRFSVILSLSLSEQGVRGALIPVVQTPFWRRHKTMLLDEAPALERAVFARCFEGKLP